jgi:hypothetical protein
MDPTVHCPTCCLNLSYCSDIMLPLLNNYLKIKITDGSATCISKFYLRASPLGYREVQVFERRQWPSDLVNMECCSVRECVCAVELFIRTGSIIETQQGFSREWNQQETPSTNAIRRWVRQWHEEGSVRPHSHCQLSWTGPSLAGRVP